MNDINRALSVANWIPIAGFRFAPFEGYRPGVFGIVNGPERSFDALAHEMAHAIHAVRHDQAWRLGVRNYGLEIKSGIWIDGHFCYEPETMQATTLECEVFGIQHHILLSAGCHPGYGYSLENARILSRFMPDWIHGGDTEDERVGVRCEMIESYASQYTLKEIIDIWVEVMRWASRQEELDEHKNL